MDNFRDGVPLNLLSQFMPIQYKKVRYGKLGNNPEGLISDWVAAAVDEYLYATRQDQMG